MASQTASAARFEVFAEEAQALDLSCSRLRAAMQACGVLAAGAVLAIDFERERQIVA